MSCAFRDVCFCFCHVCKLYLYFGKMSKMVEKRQLLRLPPNEKNQTVLAMHGSVRKYYSVSSSHFE